jgi:hypothetical protein
MKHLIVAIFLFINFVGIAQKPCEIYSNINDSIGTYKLTKQATIFERSFAGNSTNIFFALSNTNGVLGLEIQQLNRSAEFIKAYCLDSNSRIYLQLNNGKIVTLIYSGNETCGSLIRNDKAQNSRILSGSFVFINDNFEALKVSPVTFMRIKYASETVDYPLNTGFVSELDKKMYEPEKYFMDFIKCVEN